MGRCLCYRDSGYDPYATAERQLEELLGHTASPSPPAKPSPHRHTDRSPSPLKTDRSPSPGRPPAPLSPAPAPDRSPSPGRSAFAKIERPRPLLFPLRGDVLKPTALPPRKDPIAEAISILNEYAIQQRSADEPPPSPPSSVESSQTVINRYDFVSSAIAAYRENAESMPPPPEPEPEPPTNASPPTNHGSRRLSGAPAETPPPADGDTPPPPPPPPQHGWSEPPWRPIDDNSHG